MRTWSLRASLVGFAVSFAVVAASVVPAQAAEATDGWALVSCVVAPGFDYRDFELLSARELLRLYPQHAEMIRRLNGS